MEYRVAKTEVVNPDINSKEWDKADVGHIACVPWEGYCEPPKTTFKLLRGPKGISVLMHTDEKDLRAEVTKENGEICDDSCMEFFFKPDPWDVNYLNFEINPKGVMHLGLGKDRYGRTLIDEPRSTFSIETIPNDGDWTLKYYIPDSFLLKYFKKLHNVCRANFYKCGEETGHSHYATWAMVESEEPDYHVADFFEKLRIEK
ncbi:MAG: hypothetical protein J6L59_02715 [Clostridia bacterium]|nr:hypothetical protein [Clostridia bacterium]